MLEGLRGEESIAALCRREGIAESLFDAFTSKFNEERPHEALDMKTPSEAYVPPSRAYEGLPEVEDGIWLIGFMHYDLGYIDLEQRTLQTIDNPFGRRVATHVLGAFCYPCLRVEHRRNWSGR